MAADERGLFTRFWDWVTGAARSDKASPGFQAQERQGRTGSTNVNADPNSVQTDPSTDTPSTASAASSDPTPAEQRAESAAEAAAARAEARANKQGGN